MTQEPDKEIIEEEAKESEQEMYELPPVTFEDFVLNLYNIALMNLGYRDPESGKVIRNLPMSKHTIDTIGMLEEKTKGNLTAPESNMLSNILYELRMNYLRASNQAQSESENNEKKEENKEEKEENKEEKEEKSDSQ